MYLAEFLNDFLSRMAQTSHSIEAITALSPFSQASVWHETRRRYQYYGLADFLKFSLYALTNKILSLLFRKFPSVGCHSLSNVVAKYKIKRLDTVSINDYYFIGYVRKNQIDLVVSIAAPQLFEKELLSLPKKGCINYHSALLPKYRGRQPLFWALLNGEKEVGISIHEMDEELDNGPTIVQERIPVSPADSLHSLYLKTIQVGPQLLIKAIQILDENNPARIKNDRTQATAYRFPTREDARKFKLKGERFF